MPIRENRVQKHHSMKRCEIFRTQKCGKNTDYILLSRWTNNNRTELSRKHRLPPSHIIGNWGRGRQWNRKPKKKWGERPTKISATLKSNVFSNIGFEEHQFAKWIKSLNENLPSWSSRQRHREEGKVTRKRLVSKPDGKKKRDKKRKKWKKETTMEKSANHDRVQIKLVCVKHWFDSRRDIWTVRDPSPIEDPHRTVSAPLFLSSNKRVMRRRWTRRIRLIYTVRICEFSVLFTVSLYLHSHISTHIHSFIVQIW